MGYNGAPSVLRQPQPRAFQESPKQPFRRHRPSTPAHGRSEHDHRLQVRASAPAFKSGQYLIVDESESARQFLKKELGDLIMAEAEYEGREHRGIVVDRTVYAALCRARRDHKRFLFRAFGKNRQGDVYPARC